MCNALHNYGKCQIKCDAAMSILVFWLQRRETPWSSCLLHSLVPWAEMKCMSVMHRIDVWICQGTTN